MPAIWIKCGGKCISWNSIKRNGAVISEDNKVITLGIAMSGAISAGAYSAGVLDFLIEALEEWEKAKASGAPGVPRHRVVIAAMSGASAGAITAAVGAVSAARPLKPSDGSADVEKIRHDKMPSGKDAFHLLPDLYTAWVDLPDFLEANPEVTDKGKRYDVGALLGLTDLMDARKAFEKAKEDYSNKYKDKSYRKIQRNLNSILIPSSIACLWKK